jgi:peptidylprolyl isomerase
MRRAKAGDRVKIHYTLMLDGGRVLESSKNQQPLEFTIGKGKVLPGIENHILGMRTGEKRISILPPSEMGTKRSGGVTIELRRSDFPQDIALHIGLRIAAQQSDGEPMDLFITQMDEESVTLSEHHPLAGKRAVISIELIEIS